MWEKNGSCIQAGLATVLIVRGHYQEAKKELKRSGGKHGVQKQKAYYSRNTKMQKKTNNSKKKENRTK